MAEDLEPVVSELCRQLGLSVAFRDPGVGTFGLHNAVMPVGDTFLEVVSPNAPGPGTTAGRFLQRRGGDGGYMAIFQVGDLAAAKVRLAGLGMRLVWEGSVPGISGAHVHPRDIGGAIVSFDQADPPEGWPWAGPEWPDHVGVDQATSIVGIEIQATEPEAMARRWSAALDRPLEARGDGLVIGVDAGTIRFVADGDGRGDAIRAVDVGAGPGAAGRSPVDICGVEFRFV